jgi:ferredoxin
MKITLNPALKEQIAAQAQALGFAACGFASAGEDPVRAARLGQWLEEGMHGSMDWMESREHHRRSPQGLWPEARTVIALGMSYAPAFDPLALEGDEERARISVYAQGADYHDIVKKALKHLARWIVEHCAKQGIEAGVKVFVDTAPVMEKPLGEASGIGWQGKHTNMVSRTHGSWLFLGAIYTTLELEPDTMGRNRCGSCDACQTACPTDAFPPLPAGCAPLRFVFNDRTQRPDPGGIPRKAGQPHLRLRRLPRRLPMEQIRGPGPAQSRLPAPRRAGRAASGRVAGAGRRRFPQAVLRLAHQADRAGPVCAELFVRGGEFRELRSGGAGARFVCRPG